MQRFFNPVSTHIGHGAFAQMPQIVANTVGTPRHAVLVVWHQDVLSLPMVQAFVEQATYPISAVVFDKANPTVENLYDLHSQTREIPYDLVIAIGGGSVLDVAKILCCIKDLPIHREDDVRNIIIQKSYQRPSCPWIGVPTTAGTGSEVTCWATIWDVKLGKKLSVEREDNYAVAAVVDAAFASTMPMPLAVASALDALAHATESYWAKDTNPVTKALALHAIKTILRAMDGFVAHGGDTAGFEAMAQGSMLAGMAFSNTHTTACHSLSYPLTMHFNIPHGVAVSMLIGPMIVFNADCLEDTDSLLEAFGVKSILEIGKKLDILLQKANIQSTLNQWNVPKSQIPFLVENAFTKGRIDNNPRVLTTDDVSSIYHSIYELPTGIV